MCVFCLACKCFLSKILQVSKSPSTDADDHNAESAASESGECHSDPNAGNPDALHVVHPPLHIRKEKIGSESGAFLIFTSKIRKAQSVQSLDYFSDFPFNKLMKNN